jgi:hypothetical protein
MPDNSMSDSEPNIDIPRQPIANDPDFGVIRMLDGHKAHTSGEEGANIHHP